MSRTTRTTAETDTGRPTLGTPTRGTRTTGNRCARWRRRKTIPTPSWWTVGDAGRETSLRMRMKLRVQAGDASASTPARSGGTTGRTRRWGERARSRTRRLAKSTATWATQKARGKGTERSTGSRSVTTGAAATATRTSETTKAAPSGKWRREGAQETATWPGANAEGAKNGGGARPRTGAAAARTAATPARTKRRPRLRSIPRGRRGSCRSRPRRRRSRRRCRRQGSRLRPGTGKRTRAAAEPRVRGVAARAAPRARRRALQEVLRARTMLPCLAAGAAGANDGRNGRSSSSSASASGSGKTARTPRGEKREVDAGDGHRTATTRWTWVRRLCHPPGLPHPRRATAPRITGRGGTRPRRPTGPQQGGRRTPGGNRTPTVERTETVGPLPVGVVQLGADTRTRALVAAQPRRTRSGKKEANEARRLARRRPLRTRREALMNTRRPMVVHSACRERHGTTPSSRGSSPGSSRKPRDAREVPEVAPRRGSRRRSPRTALGLRLLPRRARRARRRRRAAGVRGEGERPVATVGGSRRVTKKTRRRKTRAERLRPPGLATSSRRSRRLPLRRDQPRRE
mmetsp:Transcript_16787/g.45900  ORF Transcript_16787/g.45900 Transcript_16787/m.45900 type:complete len:574 (-) Transcript_16787:358-2079(-)